MSFEGYQLSVIINSIVLLILASVCLFFRCLARLTIRAFGPDDYFMLIAELFFIATCTVCIYAGFAGFGAHSTDLDLRAQRGARHAFFVFVPLYILTLIFVKWSICFSLLRFAIERHMRWAIWSVFVFSTLCGIASFLGTLAGCQPLHTGWDNTPGTLCSNNDYLAVFGYFLSGTAMVTDLACSILPTIMLWNLQVNRRLKITLCGVLSLGFLASAATMVRFRYIVTYSKTTDDIYVASQIVVWSLVELGVGMVAACLPTLKPLLKRSFKSLFSPCPSQREAGYRMSPGDEISSQTRVIVLSHMASASGGAESTPSARSKSVKNTSNQAEEELGSDSDEIDYPGILVTSDVHLKSEANSIPSESQFSAISDMRRERWM